MLDPPIITIDDRHWRTADFWRRNPSVLTGNWIGPVQHASPAFPTGEVKMRFFGFLFGKMQIKTMGLYRKSLVVKTKYLFR